MGEASSDNERGDQERGDGGSSDGRVGIGDVVQHAEPQQGVAEAENTTSDDGRPERGVTVAGEGEPEKGNREQPDGDERREETSLGATDTTVLEAVALKEPGLDRDEHEHDHDTNNKVEVGQVGTNVGQTVVDDKHIKDSVQVEEQETVGETVVNTEQGDHGLGHHNAECHQGNKLDLLKDVDLLLKNSNLLGLVQVTLLDLIADNDAGQRLGDEAHDHDECSSNNDAIFNGQHDYPLEGALFCASSIKTHLIQKIQGRPMLTLSAIHSPTGDPILGPMLAEATKSAMGWPAPSSLPNRSAMVPATLHKATLPVVPLRNWKMMSMGKLRGSAQPMLTRA